MRTRLILASLLATVSIVLTACGGSGDTPAAFNSADVSFASDMIPHHEQATEMAALAPGRTTNQDVLKLASAIEKAQKPEITTMSGWLKSWGKDVPSGSGSMGGMDHSAMPGMMSDSDLADLKASSGTAFDRTFLSMMIAHHTGALTMAKDEASQGKYSPAIELAGSIRSTQTEEIALMKSLLNG